MKHPVARFFVDDHRRLGDLLGRAIAEPSAVDPRLFGALRAGLLRHIGMEEKLLFPALREIRGSDVDTMLAKLRLDHGAIVSLLVPSPQPAVVHALQSILAMHNRSEEQPGGAYTLCDELSAGDTLSLLERLRATPAVPVKPFNDAPIAMASARRAIALAGYDPDALFSGDEG